MNYTIITSKDNATIKNVSKLLSSAKEREATGLCVLEGLRILKDALENNVQLHQLFFTENAINKFDDDIKKFAQQAENCYLLSESVFSKISDTKTPQGVIATAFFPKTTADSIKKQGKYIALENLQDPSNLGAVSRTAEALGVDGIIISRDSCDPFSPKALRTSMGTLLRVPVFICEDIVTELKDTGLRMYACVVRDYELKIGSFKFEEGCVAVIGNEANGLSEQMINACHKKVTISMNGRAESLNASVAASIVMWEMTKQ